jgi:hypothetical protein
MSETQFWVVWSPQGSKPMVRHVDGKSATTEAERLASLHPGNEFYVLKAVRVSRAVRTITVTLDPPSSNEPPF